MPALRSLAACALALLLPAAHAQSLETLEPSGSAEGTRVALVLGNADYAGTAADLANPSNDAAGMAQALRRVGFTVVLGTDLGAQAMQTAVTEFAGRAAGADVALLFYAGHGAEIAGDNYLISVDEPPIGGDLRDASVPLSAVLSALGQAETRLIVLDACRNNPFGSVPDDGRGMSAAAGGGDGDRGAGGGSAAASGTSNGWAATDANAGTLVAYGTAPGEVAQDSDGQGSQHAPFTTAMLQTVEVPGLEMAELMRRVTRIVRELTDDRQQPWLSASYTAPFYFVPAADAPSFEPEAAPVADVERWYREGRRAYRDERYDAALDPFRRAAAAGHPGAQFYLGAMHMRGRGVSEDRSEAAHWFGLAAAAGHARAQYLLGGLYHGGFGVSQDDARAVDLYERAAEQGLPVAMFRLGVTYESGRGRPQSVSEAVRWYRQAATRGHADAHDALRRLAEDGNADAQRALQGTP